MPIYELAIGTVESELVNFVPKLLSDAYSFPVANHPTSTTSGKLGFEVLVDSVVHEPLGLSTINCTYGELVCMNPK